MSDSNIYSNTTRPTRGGRPKLHHKGSCSRQWVFPFGFLVFTWTLLCATSIWLHVQILTANPDVSLRLEISRGLETQQKLSQMLQESNRRVKCLRNLILMEDYSSKCPPGWTMVNQKCYFFSVDKKTREQSERFCVESGAVLATVRSKDSILKCHLQGQGAGYWVGLELRMERIGNRQEKHWIWSDKTTELSLPTDDYSSCVKLEKSLEISSCSDLLLWICERKPDKSSLLNGANKC